MPIDIGSEIEAKVTGVTNFGAFMELPEGKVGLVHISQVANTYVTDVGKHLKIGDIVKVKVLGMAKEGETILILPTQNKVDSGQLTVDSDPSWKQWWDLYIRI